MRDRSRRRACRSALGSLGLVALVASAAAASDPDVRATMHKLFAQIRVVLPLALEDHAFSNPDNRERIGRALEAFRLEARSLAEHGRSGEAGFAHQSVSLAQHADRIARSYERGDYRASRYLLQQTLDDCVACHSRLPTAHEFPLGRQLLADIDLAALSLRERARLQVVARQFDAALASYEAAFAEPGAGDALRVNPEDWVAYLKICLTIENDSTRALATLGRLRAREDLDPRLVADVPIWMAAIADQQADPVSAEPLVRARMLLRAEEALGLSPASRGGLVHQVEAWHELQRFVASASEPSPELAEAYYLLGLVESRMLRPFGSAAASPYLEAAIRSAPGAATGRDAYALLEELTILDYTGSGGTRIPADVRAKLDELKRTAEPRP